EDVVVGMVEANRDLRGAEKLAGNFGNLLALRTQISGDPVFSELLEQVRQHTETARQHRELPFEKLLEELRPTPDQSYHPICQVFLTWEKAIPAITGASGMRMTQMRMEQDSSKFDLHFKIVDTAEGLELQVVYA